MKGTALIPRVGLTWLLLAQALAIIPHLLHLPLWVLPLWLLCAGWRVQAYRMRARLPNRLVRIGLLAVTSFAVFFSVGSLFGLDGGVLLLVATFSLKLVELRTVRDALLLIFLGFFVVVTGYLFNDGPLAALYSLLPITALLAALIGLQQSRLAAHPIATLKLAGVLQLQALPLMLLLFLFFPRIGPLWSLPSSQKAMTGLAESMTPGDIAELSRSPELAFRASFAKEIPPRADLYWRALTLDHFDGRRWSQNPYNRLSTAPMWQAQGPQLDYSIVMQPSGQPWLFSLDTARTDLPGARQTGDFRLEFNHPIRQRLLYNVQSWPQVQRQLELPERVATRALQLPNTGDSQARQWGQALAREHSGDTDAIVASLLRHFNQQPYGYTLKPPTLGRNSIDEFLFETRLGFCAHYAGAMTYVLRAAGIPARVVAGYQGGELNSSANYLAVRQMDAHAWVEYWQAGRGWVSVDPTFQVAPERIELGADLALAEDEGFLENSPFSPLRYRNVEWLNELRLGWDGFNYNWQRWVLGYQSSQQLSLFKRLFGNLDWQAIALLLLSTATLVIVVLALCLLKPWQREKDPVRRTLQRFEKLLGRHGVTRELGEPVGQFCQRAGQLLAPQQKQIAAFAQAFERLRYSDSGTPDEQQLHDALKALKQGFRRFKR